MTTRLALLILAGGLIFGAWTFWRSANDQSAAERAYESAAPADLANAGPSKAELSPEALRGRIAFNQACATCHGRDAAGGPGGPPLIHKIYEPSHHADGAFRLAVSRGVVQHHWDFGNMPPQSDKVDAEDVENIIAFVRETQRADGIF